MTLILNPTIISHGYNNRIGNIKRALNIAIREGWLPIKSNCKKFYTLLDIFSWIYGDGHLHSSKNSTHFYLSGQKKDLETIARKIRRYFHFEIVIKEDPYKNREVKNKETSILYIKGKNSQIFARLLKALGAPAGNKVKTSFLLPEWLLNSSKDIQKRFLEVLFSNEIAIKKLEKNKAIPNFDLRMDKEKKQVIKGIVLFKQICSLIKNLGIKTRGPQVYENKSKENCTINLTITKEMINIYKFYKIFDLRYASKKQNRLDKMGLEIENRLKKHLQNIQKYKKVMKIRKSQKLGRRKLARMFNLNTWKVDGWLRRNNKPLFLNREKELKNLFKKC